MSATEVTGAPRLHVAFIGISHDHAWGKAEAVRRSPHMDLVGAFEPDAAEWERQRARNQFGDVRHLAARDVLEDPTIEVVFIETRPHDNLRWAREALVHDKHVHIDKAPAPSLNDLRGVLSLAADRGRHVQIGYQFRYIRQIQLALRAVRSGWLGHVSRVHAELPKDNDLYARTRSGDGAYPGAMFYYLGCHILDLAVLFLGKPDGVWSTLRSDAREHGEPFVDSATAVLEYSDAVAVLQTWHAGNDAGRHRRFEVYGERGSALIEPLEPAAMRLYLSEAHEEFPAGWSTPRLDDRPRYAGDIEDLAAWIRGRRKPAYTPEHDLAVHETLLRICGAID